MSGKWSRAKGGERRVFFVALVPLILFCFAVLFLKIGSGFDVFPTMYPAAFKARDPKTYVGMRQTTMGGLEITQIPHTR